MIGSVHHSSRALSGSGFWRHLWLDGIDRIGQIGPMAEPISLNKARKAKARTKKAAEAAANRARFGRTKAEKERERIDRDRAKRLLDGTERDK
jgi:hypothetical protein